MIGLNNQCNIGLNNVFIVLIIIEYTERKNQFLFQIQIITLAPGQSFFGTTKKHITRIEHR